MKRNKPSGWVPVVLIAAIAVSSLVPPRVLHAAEALEKGASGLPLPRFVSLGSDVVNVRMGPTRNHKIKWTFKKSGLPVEIVREYGNWRRVRDADGEEGWVHVSLLSNRRTAIVSPWAQDGSVPLRAEPSASAQPTAYLEPFVLARIERCDGSWCAIAGSGWQGLVPQQLLWGVYPRETVN